MIGDGEVLSVVTFSLDTGGSERVAAAVAAHLAGLGVPTSVCATHGGVGPVGEALIREGIPCSSLAVGGGGRAGRAVRLYRHLRDTGTTVLHVHHFNMLASAYLPARLAGVRRIVVTEHSNHQMRNRALARRRASFYGRRADMITVVHDGLATYLRREIGLPDALVHTIPNGVDTIRYSPGRDASARRKLGVSDGQMVFGCVGRLHPDKDPMNLVRAVASLTESARSGLRVLLVGDGILRTELEACIAANRLEDIVTMLGERQDVADLLGALDAFVLPSRTEGLPVALLEAMSSGLPVIATRVGGVPAVVDDTGLLVPPEDPLSLGEAIAQLAGDEGLRGRLGMAARLRAVETYDRGQMFARYCTALFPERSAPPIDVD